MRTTSRNKRDRQSGQAMMFTVVALGVTSAIGLVAISAVVRSLATEGSLRRQAAVESLAESASEEVFGRLAKSTSSLSAVTSHPGYSTGTDVGTASSVWVRYGTDGQVVTCTLGSQACFTVRLAAHGFTAAGVATADIDMATSAVIQVTARQCRESEISSAQVVARSASSPESKASCVYARRQTTIRSRLFSDHVIWVNTMANTKFATSDSIAGSIHLGTIYESFKYCGTPTIAKDTSVTPNVSYRIETLASTVVDVATSCTSTGSQVVSASTTASSDALALPVVSASDYASIANATISTAVTSPAAIVLSGSNYTLNGGSSTAIPSSGVLYVNGPATISQTTSLTGKLTIAASGDIAITSSLQLTSQVDDMLSIVSTAGNINISFSAASRTIEALLLAPSLTAGQGIVQTASANLSSTPTYPLYLYGAIVARELGALGTITPETGATTAGYSKSFTYDSRLATSQPPYALSQVRGRWIRLATTTVSPMTPGISGIATTTTASNTAPTVSFTAPTTPSSSRTLSYTVTFSERISGLASSEFTNTGTATSCTFSIPNSYGITFTLTVVCSSDGTVIVQLAASSVIDNLGLSGPSSVSDASTVTISSAATALAMETQPVGGASPTTFATDPKIKLVSSSGDLVTTTGTTITVTASGGTLSGTTSMTTTSGYAEFTNLTLTAAAGTYTLTFASTGLTSVTTASFTITTSATLDQCVANIADPTVTAQTILTATGFANEAALQSAISANTWTMQLATGSGSFGTLNGNKQDIYCGNSQDNTVTMLDSNESTWDFFWGGDGNDSVGTMWKSFFFGGNGNDTATTVNEQGFFYGQSGTDTNTTNNSSTVDLGAATKLTLTTAPAGAVSGVALTTQPVVAIQGEITQNAGWGFTLSVTERTFTVLESTATVTATVSAGGTLIGTINPNAVAGVATFTNLGITAAAGTYTLTFASTGLTSVTSGSLTVSVTASTSTAPVSVCVATNATTAITGISVGGLASGSTYLVSVALINGPTSSGLQITTNTGVTEKFGYSVAVNTNFTSTVFTGTLADVNAVLATLRYVGSSTAASSTTVKVTASLENASYVLNPTNGHFYFLNTNLLNYNTATTGARDAAKAMSYQGQSGYVATITSASENTFISTNIASATNIWIGATDDLVEGAWKWDTSGGSPEAGKQFWTGAAAGSRFLGDGLDYASWSSGVEPNDSGGAEDYALTNWGGIGNATWNDCPNTGCGAGRQSVVEFGTNAPDNGYTVGSSTYSGVTTSLAPGSCEVVSSLADTNTSGTLRYAITQANGSSAINSIIFSSATTGTITLTSDLPTLTQSVEIHGTGRDTTTISGNSLYRAVNNATNGLTVTIKDLTFTSGKNADGGIVNTNSTSTSSTFNITNVKFTSSSSIAWFQQHKTVTTFTNCLFTSLDTGIGSDYGNTPANLTYTDSGYDNRIYIYYSTFTSNTTAISTQRFTKIENSTFTSNGNAASLNGRNRQQVLNSTFTSNTSTAVYLSSLIESGDTRTNSTGFQMVKGNTFTSNGVAINFANLFSGGLTNRTTSVSGHSNQWSTSVNNTFSSNTTNISGSGYATS